MSSKTGQRILVTGGTGFAGSHLVERLLSQGHQVCVISTGSQSGERERMSDGAQIVAGSITDPGLVDQAVAGCNAVYHLAAAFRRVDLPKSVYWDVNVNGTRHLLEAAHKHGVKKFIYCSTCGVHGNVTNPPATEDAPIAPEDYYQETKVAGEKVAREYMERGLDVTIVRPAAIYGPGDADRWSMLFRRVAKRRFIMLGSGKTTYHPVYIDNLVDGFLLAREKEQSRGQTYLIADEHYYAIDDIVRIIADVLGVSVRIIHLPYWPGFVAAAVTEGVSAVLKVKPPIFRRRIEWFRRNRAFDITKARRELGYEPRVDLFTGLRRTAEWYRQEHILA